MDFNFADPICSGIVRVCLVYKIENVTQQTLVHLFQVCTSLFRKSHVDIRKQQEKMIQTYIQYVYTRFRGRVVCALDYEAGDPGLILG